MLLMRLVRDVISDVMEQGSCQHQCALMTCQLFYWSQRLKQLVRKLCYLSRMCFFISKPATDTVNTEQLLIGKIRNRRSCLIFTFLEVIDNHTFAQRPITCAQGVDSQRPHRC